MLGCGLASRDERVGVWNRSCRATVLDSIPSIASIIPMMLMMRGNPALGRVGDLGTGTCVCIYSKLNNIPIFRYFGGVLKYSAIFEGINWRVTLKTCS